MERSSDSPDDPSVESAAVQAANSDPILAERLASPESSKDIYLEEASLYRPIVTGDIFTGLRVPGCLDADANHGLSMIIAHPSVMRQGAQLEERARAAPVAPRNGLRRSQWSPGYYDVYPLPVLTEIAGDNGFDIANRGWCAVLQDSAPIETKLLDVRQRVACLSPLGIEILLQRMVHSDTRVPVKAELIGQVFAPKLEEIELLETWCEELVSQSSEHLQRDLEEAARDFEGFLSTTSEYSEMRIRDMMESSSQRAGARRLILAEIRRRRNS